MLKRKFRSDRRLFHHLRSGHTSRLTEINFGRIYPPKWVEATHESETIIFKASFILPDLPENTTKKKKFCEETQFEF